MTPILSKPYYRSEHHALIPKPQSNPSENPPT